MKKEFFQHYGSTLQEQARDLRKNMTEPERKLWFCFLKEQKQKFSCQKVVGPYILDFFCPELRMAIELDGESHTETVEHDRLRAAYLEEQNIKILRFTNEDVMKRFESVCEAIYREFPRPPLTGGWHEVPGGCIDYHIVSACRYSDIKSQPPVSFADSPLIRGHEGERTTMKTVEIYTDGACSGNPGPGGWGAILCYNGVEKELSGGERETTNNRMELSAVIAALKALKQPCIVELYSDSKYVIDALQKGWVWGWKKKGWIKSDKKPALNVDLWEQLLPLIQTHEMHYHWVKGHAENEKNNRCDQMAVAESKKFR